MQDGSVIEFPGAGDEHPDKSAGSIIFKVVTTKDERFERSGDNLRTTHHISLVEVLIFSRLSRNAYTICYVINLAAVLQKRETFVSCMLDTLLWTIGFDRI